MPAKKSGSAPTGTAPDEITINKDQARLLTELLDRLKPNDNLTQRDWNDIALKVGTKSAKAAKERLRYLLCVLENRPTKASRVKPGQSVQTTITPSRKASARSASPWLTTPQTKSKKRKTPPPYQSPFDAGPTSKRSKAVVSTLATQRAVAKVEMVEYDDDEEEGEEDEAEEAEEVEEDQPIDFAHLVRQQQIPVEAETLDFSSSSLPRLDMRAPTMDFSSLMDDYDYGVMDTNYDMAEVQRYFGK